MNEFEDFLNLSFLFNDIFINSWVLVKKKGKLVGFHEWLWYTNGRKWSTLAIQLVWWEVLDNYVISDGKKNFMEILSSFFSSKEG